MEALGSFPPDAYFSLLQYSVQGLWGEWYGDTRLWVCLLSFKAGAQLLLRTKYCKCLNFSSDVCLRNCRV